MDRSFIQRQGVYFSIGILLLTFPLVLADPSWKSLWPSAVALSWVVLTRRVLWSLLAGAFAGALILAHGNPLQASFDLVQRDLLPSFGSSWKTGAVIFTFILGGFVALIEAGGGLQNWTRRHLVGGSARKLEFGGFCFGLICFFDGLANSLMVGRLFKPLFDTAGVSRAKLAYIVDTTSAAVACLAFVSTWIAYQLSMIREGLLLAGAESVASPYVIFFHSLAYNYYAWFALILLGLSILWRFEPGPMKDAKVFPSTTSQMISQEGNSPGRLSDSLLPLGFLVVFILAGLYWNGAVLVKESIWPITIEKVSLAYGAADAPIILITGAGIASILAFLLMKKRKDPSRSEIYLRGVESLFRPILILVGAWMLSSTLSALGTADFLGHALSGQLDPRLLSSGIFLAASATSFSTGTSWGTMGILMPLAIPLVFATHGSDPELTLAGLSAVTGAVFSGAVFGDHCSPISDTTIVSSIACDLDPMDHVKTQMPYALIAGGVAFFLGFLPSGFLGTGWPGLILGFCGLVLIVKVCTRQ